MYCLPQVYTSPTVQHCKMRRDRLTSISPSHLFFPLTLPFFHASHAPLHASRSFGLPFCTNITAIVSSAVMFPAALFYCLFLNFCGFDLLPSAYSRDLHPTGTSTRLSFIIRYVWFRNVSEKVERPTCCSRSLCAHAMYFQMCLNQKHG